MLQVESVEGIFVCLLLGNKIGIFVGENYEIYGYDEVIVFIDQNGNVIKFVDIIVDSIIEVQCEIFFVDKKMVVICVKFGIVNKSDSGVIVEVSIIGKMIKFINVVGIIEQFMYGDNLIICYQD